MVTRRAVRVVLSVLLVSGLASDARLHVSARTAQVIDCVGGHGYWKAHGPDWPVRSMVLGDPQFAGHIYSQDRLLSFLNGPTKGDASLILVLQLIAAKLNQARTGYLPIADTVAQADALMAMFRRPLPYGVGSMTPIGAQMTAIAAILEQYNTGQIPGSCGQSNSVPVANAGSDQTVARGTLVNLDGSASNDADGDPLTFEWAFESMPAGSAATVANAAAVKPSFTADLLGTYVLRLIVRDTVSSSVADTVSISTRNSPPVAHAGPDATGINGDTITLDGSGSIDVDGDPLTYHWTFLTTPATSSALLTNATAVNPSFAIDVSGDYVVQLVVNDGVVDSVADEVTITTRNSPPIANAGPPQSVLVGSLVHLDGSGSTDVDGDPLTFEWSLTTAPAGSAAAIADPTLVKPAFTPDLPGTYVAQLIVRDPSSSADPSTVTIEAQPTTPANRPPTAEAGNGQTIPLGGTVQLDGTASSDLDNDPLTYHWSLTSPAGSSAALDDPLAVNPAFVADVAGSYVAQLIVNDGAIDSLPDTVSISTDNSMPVADAGDDATVARGVTVQLDGSGSSDPDGTPLQTAWSLTSRPPGSSAALSDSGIVNPTFVADVDGAYVAQLIVGDGALLSAPDTVSITAAPGADLSLTFYGAPSNPAVGSSASWGISVHNLGPATTTDVRVRAAFPAGYTFTAKSAFAGSYDETTGIWTIGPMVNGAGVSLAIVGTVNGTGPYDLTATIIETSTPDPNLANNTRTDVVTPNDSADLAISFYAAASNPPVGSTSSWGIQVHNLGPADATNVRIRAAFPAGYTFTSKSVPVGSYDEATGIWTLGTVVRGAGPNFAIAGIVNSAGPYDLTATIIESSAPDPNPANNTRTDIVTPNANADLRVSFFGFSSGTRQPGDIATMLFDVINDGPASASNVAAEIKIPAGFTIASLNVTGGTTYDQVTGNWTIGDMHYGRLVRVQVDLRVNATGPIELRAAVTNSRAPDPNLSNNVVIPPRINRPPVANAGADQPASAHSLVSLDGSASFDADGDPITYEWGFALRPINSAATLSSLATASSSFVPDLGGAYVAQLRVTDSFGLQSAPDVATISTVVTNRPPVIGSLPVTTAAVTQNYGYDVDATDPDVGDPLTFSLTTAPAGMTIAPASGLITWTPTENQAGPQLVGVRVQDAEGLFATQSFAIQASSPGNGAPLATDDAYSVRVSESLSESAPGVVGNDTDESALAARLISPPGNGTVLLNQDGSFTYAPHVMNPGEFVLAENVNLAARIPGVTVLNAPSNCPRCAIDESLSTKSATFGGPIEIVFPADVTVSQVTVQASRSQSDGKISAAIFELIDANGVELYDSGPVEIPGPLFDATLNVPNVPGVRRVRLTPTASPTHLFFTTLAELKVIGSGLIRREPFVEPNLVQLLPATVTASSELIGNVKESLTDESDSNWYSTGNTVGGDFIEVTFPVDVTVTQLNTFNPSARPDGFFTSLEILCSGTFALLDANRGVLFTSGVVSEPSGGMGGSFTLDVPSVAGVRHVRYTAASCTGNFPPGFSEWRILGSASLTTPAFSLAKKFQSLQGREAHSTPIVVNLTDDNGDGVIDADDIPDIVVPVEAIGDQLRGEIKAIGGADGQELFTAGGPNLVSPWSDLAAADIDGDGAPEIVGVHSDGNHLIAFDHTGALKWVSDANPMPFTILGSSVIYTGAIAIANLDGAGAPEIVVGAAVFDADGRLLSDGRTLNGTTAGTGLRSAIPAIGDVDLDGTPELIAGPTAYGLSGGQLTKVWQRTDRSDGYVAIANLDDDPQAEIVNVANGAVYVLNHDGSDYQDWNAPSHAPLPIPGGGQGGAPLVVDVDGDGLPEIGVAAASHYVLFNRDGSVRWMSAISDRTSNFTGAVAFDLNGDGEVEVIYRDEYFLRIYRGADGVLLAKTPVGSATWAEEPVVADVDNDGHADIVVSSDFFRQSPDETGIIVFQDVANKWKRTRRIWNQHSYHVTNVNEDATIPVNESAHWLVPGLNAFRTNAFVPGESADETDSFTYVATDGVLESNVATVRIAIRTPNASPQITSSPVTAAAVGVGYLYAVRANDPDAGDILTFSLPQAPPGMAIDASSGLIEWQPADGQLGAETVTVKVSDVRGLFALQQYVVHVAPPIAVPDILGQAQAAAETAIAAANLTTGGITSRHSASIAQGSVLSQNPAGGSPAAPGAPVSFVVSLGPPPVGVVPNVVGLTQASAQQDVQAAGYASAASGQSSATIVAGIVVGQNPAGGTAAETTTLVSLVVSLGPPPGELDLDLDGFTGNEGDCNDTNPAINPSVVDIPGDGIDQNCNGVDSIAGDSTFPVASIETPAEDAEITMPTDILGTATDANFLRYRLLVASVDEDDDAFVEIGGGTTPVISAVLGRLDPTLRENGIYRVRLLVEDVNGQISFAERTYRVSGGAKVGVFSVSFVDLQVPFAGIPITVVRTYDSRVKTQRDFGFGWSLQVKTGTYQNNRRPGDGWTITTASGPFGLPCSVTTETRSHLTEVRLSEREFYLFKPKLTKLAALVGGCVGTFAYEFVKGPYAGATLEVIGGGDFIYTSGNVLTHFDGGADTGLLFNPQRVRLTTADKRVIDLESRSGVTRIQDANENAVEIAPGGITHSSGRSIAFDRDALERIVRITDLRGFPLAYGYDVRGDLVAFTDQAEKVTTYTYDTQHLLSEIWDPEGNRAVRSEYDTEGRLIAVIDAKGVRTEFTHEVGARSEVIQDGLGNDTQIVYDDLGNILSKVTTVTIDGVPVTASTQFEYDSNGNETVIVDADNRRIESLWDALGNQLTSAIDPAGLNLSRQFTYTPSGFLLTETAPNGDVTRFTVDPRTGDATSWVDVDGRAMAVEYDRAGNVTRAIDPDGRATKLTYDEAGRLLSRTDAQGLTVTYTYDAAGNKVTETTTRTVDGVLRQLTSRFEYDARNRLTRTVDPLGRSTQMAYDGLGRQVSMSDALGRTTTFEFDAIGDLVKTEYPDGTTELRKYDARGDVIQVTDREGLVTKHQYDELRRLVATTLPTGGVARYVYSAGGRQLATIASDGARTDYDYDTAGRRVLTRGPAVADGASGLVRPEWLYEYDEVDRLVAETDPLGRREEVRYDTAARSVTARLADGTEASEFRDQWGRPKRRVDQEGRVIDFSYVGDTGWLSRVTLPPPASGQPAVSWQFEYDEAGKRTAQIDPLGRRTQFAYDEVGRLRRVTLPAGEKRTLSYDLADRVTALNDYDGQTTRFEYDLADRLTRRQLADGTEVKFTYTTGGRRATAEDARGVTSYAYDATGRMTQVDQPDAGTVQYDYDTTGRVTSIETASATSSYTYDALGRVTGVQSSTGSTAYRYDLAGNLSTLEMPNGITASFAHDVRNQMTSLSYERGGSTLATFGYAYTPAGRRKTITEPGATTDFSYDQIGRLISETRSGSLPFARQFEYDLAGNRTRTTTNGLQVVSTYDVNDRLLAAGGVSYTYDPRGNVASRNQAGAVSTFGWTSDNRLASVTNVNGTTAFDYDADGTRVAKSSAAGTIRYLVDSVNPTGLRQALEERDAGGGLVAAHQFGLGLLSSSRNNVERYALADGQASVRMLADAAGQVTDQYSYDAFGNPLADNGSTDNDYRYNGQQLDDETGLYYLRNRYYDPTTGRFLSRDPVDGDPSMPLSLHRYIYGGNDPVNFADPNGDFFTLIGFSLTSVAQGIPRALEIGKDSIQLCKVKGLAKIVPFAMRVRAFTSSMPRVQEFIERLTPTFGVGTGSTPFALSFKEVLYEHPLARLEPQNLTGELRAVELAIAPAGLTETAIELAAVEFRNNTVKMTAKCGWEPFRFISFSGAVGKEVPLFDLKFCGVFSAGTISGIVNVAVGGNGFNMSETSLELAAKFAAPFLPEFAVTLLKLPRE